jgi:hypothetical protein
VVVRQLFTCINKEDGEGSFFLFQQVQQRGFLQPVGLAAQPFNPVPVYRLLEMAAAGAKSGLNWRTARRGLSQVKNLEGKERKAPPLPENPIDPLAALEFFVLFPGELTADDTL